MKLTAKCKNTDMVGQAKCMKEKIKDTHLGHLAHFNGMELYGELQIIKRTKVRVYPLFNSAYNDFEIERQAASLRWDNEEKKFYIYISLVGALFSASTLEDLISEIKKIECLEFLQAGWQYTKFPEIDFLGRLNEGMDMVKMASSISESRTILSENLSKVYKENR